MANEEFKAEKAFLKTQGPSETNYNIYKPKEPVLHKKNRHQASHRQRLWGAEIWCPTSRKTKQSGFNKNQIILPNCNETSINRKTCVLRDIRKAAVIHNTAIIYSRDVVRCPSALSHEGAWEWSELDVFTSANSLSCIASSALPDRCPEMSWCVWKMQCYEIKSDIR